MRFSAVLLLFALDIAAPSTSNPATQYFRYERPILGIPPTARETCVALDADLFARAAPQLADLRLYRDNAETPYAIRQAAPVEAAAQTLPPLNLGAQGRDTVFDAAMPEGTYSDVEVAIEAENFLATVTVTGSQTQRDAGGTKLGTFTIFDLSAQKLGRSTVLHLPPSDFRYLHFRVNGPVAPDRITGLSVLRVPEKEPAYRAVAEAAHVREENHRTIAEFTIPAHLPVDRVVFVVGEEPRSFSREVAVSVLPTSLPREANDEEPPQPEVYSGRLIRLHTVENGRRIDEEHLAIDTPFAVSLAPTKWTVAVANGDDAPLPLSSVQLTMLQRELCFEADGRSRYTLFYGDAALAAPHYDYAALHVGEIEPAEAAVSQQQVNPGYKPRPDARPITDRHPALLWSALVVVLLALGTIALRSALQDTGTSK